MFDRSLLPPADWEFILLADTHYKLETDSVEFESRRQQTARIEFVIEQINALDPAFVVHMGDLVQEFPETKAFDRAMDEAHRQLGQLNSECYFVPGNHDVGDKPDPTMPTEPVTTTSIGAYHERFGRSWAHWEAGGIDFITVNSQILNSPLRAADKQRAWLESTLRNAVSEPTFLFSHLPLFLETPTEPALGNYDCIAPPARDWLLELVESSPVTHVFSAHCHFQFRTRHGDTSFYVLPSPTFTRPGFAELFASCPPPERGRDDRPKLGFFLVRIHDGKPTFHFVRTGGQTAPRGDDQTEELLTRPTGAIPGSRFGLSLVQPLVRSGVVPAVFPASVPTRVRDDYPYLGCLELGASLLHLPPHTWHSSGRYRRHLEDFRRRGGRVIGTVLQTDSASSVDTALEAVPDLPVDEVEVRLAGSPWPWESTGAIGSTLRAATDQPVGLSVTVPGRSVPGKQHGRPRVGFRADEINALDDRLREIDLDIDRVVCGIDADDDPWDVIRSAPESASLSHIGAIDWLLSSTDHREPAYVDRLCLGFLAVASRPASRLYLEPLLALDRTMDPAPGLLDRQRNPTSVFRAARTLNTVLFGSDGRWRAGFDRRASSGRLVSVVSSGQSIVLALPIPAEGDFSFGWPDELPAADGFRRIDITRGLSQRVESISDDITVDSPTVFLDETDH